MKKVKFRPGAVFLPISSKCVRRSLYSGTGGGRRVDNGVHGFVGNITSGSSSLKISMTKTKQNVDYTRIFDYELQMIVAPCFQTFLQEISV